MPFLSNLVHIPSPVHKLIKMPYPYDQLAQVKDKVEFKKYRLTVFGLNSGTVLPPISDICQVARELAEFANSEHSARTKPLMKLTSVSACSYNVSEISKSGHAHVPVMSAGRRAIATIEYQSALPKHVFESLKHWYWVGVGAVTIQVIEVEDLLK